MWPLKKKPHQRAATLDEQWMAHYNDIDAQRPPMSSELNARLLKALKDNCPRTFKQTLEKGASPEICWQAEYTNHRDHGLPLLHYAIRNNLEDIALSLLQHGAKVNREPTYGSCLLGYAVYQGNSRMVRLLLDYGIDPQQHGKDQHWQEWPYEVAKKNHYTDIVQMIEQEPARRSTLAAAAAANKEAEQKAAAQAQAEEERAATTAEVTKRITVSKPLQLKGVKPVKPEKQGWRKVFS